MGKRNTNRRSNLSKRRNKIIKGGASIAYNRFDHIEAILIFILNFIMFQTKSFYDAATPDKRANAKASTDSKCATHNLDELTMRIAQYEWAQVHFQSLK